MTSIILSCWNAVELSQVCVHRILRWTTLPFELVIVDDGSTDGTPAWLRSFARRVGSCPRGPLRRLALLRNERNAGYPASMNRGLRAAHGRWLVFANIDAAVTDGWLSSMLAAMRAKERVGGVSPLTNVPRRSAGHRDPWAAPPSYGDLAGLDRFAAAWSLTRDRPAFVTSCGFVPGFWFMTSKEAVERIGFFDESFSGGGFEDWDLQWRLRREGFALGFAGRAYVHHAWSGALRSNGVDLRLHYSRLQREKLYRKYPAAAASRLEIRGVVVDARI